MPAPNVTPNSRTTPSTNTACFNVARAYDEARGADRGPAESPKVLKGGTGSLIDVVYIWSARRVRKGNLDRNMQ